MTDALLDDPGALRERIEGLFMELTGADSAKGAASWFARLADVTPRTVQSWMRGDTRPRYPDRIRGLLGVADRHASVLTRRERPHQGSMSKGERNAAVRRLRDDGVPVETIARAFGVTRQRVYQISENGGHDDRS